VRHGERHDAIERGKPGHLVHPNDALSVRSLSDNVHYVVLVRDDTWPGSTPRIP
jgi:hypothetical protein